MNNKIFNFGQCKDKNFRWVIGTTHKIYGKLVMMMVIEGEPYRFFEKNGDISMIPLSVLLLGEVENEVKKD